MRSRFHNRMADRCCQANVSIGDNFKAPILHIEDTNRKLGKFLMAHGDIAFSKLGRKRAMWKKLRAGVLPPDVARNVARDNAELFAKFDLEAQQQPHSE